MKKITFSFKSLLLAAGLLLGSANAWADVEITETYDFGAFITANGTANLTISGDGIAQSGTSEKKGTVKVINNLVAGGQTLNLNGRFAVDYQYNAGAQIRFMWRSSTNAYQHGLAGQWNSKGTADPQGAARFSVLNLKAGDKITFTYAKQSGKAADPYTCSASQLTGKAADAALASGTQYTVAADGNVDLYFTNNNFAISKIVIVTYGTETVSAPTMSITGVNAKARKVTITSGTSDAGNDVTTYYTTDGSTPTTSSASFTTASQEITVGESAESESTVTVKAFSVSSASAESTVSSQNVTVGTLVQLAAPTISMSSFALAGGQTYNPVYTFSSDQSEVIGNPSVTYSYSFAGGASTAGTSYTATASGSITVTVSADGYESNSTVQSIVGGNYAKTYSFDAINDVTVDTSTGDWTNPTNVGSTGWSFTSLSNCVYSLRADITLTGGMMYARATTAKTKQGFYARLGSGSIGFNLTDGEYIVFGMYGGTNNIVDSNASSKSFGQYSNIRSIDIFTPATEVDIAILDCKKYDTSAAFATAIDAESFSTALEVYAFNTSYHVTNGALTDGVRDVTGVIRNAQVNDAAATDWAGAGTFSDQQYTGAPDPYFIDNNGSQMWATQNIYGLPAGQYLVKVATRAAAANYNHVYVSNGTEDIGRVQGTHVGNTGGELDNGWSWTYVPFVITEPTNLIFGFYKDATNWAGADDWHLYRIESVPVTIGATGYTTFASSYAIDLANLPDGVTAYYASAVNGKNVVLTEKSDAAVEAGTGLVLKAAAGNYNIPVAASGAAIVGNKLVGCVTESSAYGATKYVLWNDGGAAKFCNLENYSDVAPMTIPAGKAYLDGSLYSVKFLNIVYGDETVTGVEAPEVAEAEEEEEILYNTAGVRVGKDYKGIVINEKGEKRLQK